MELTNQQRYVLEQIKQFLDSENSVFIIKGYAGTGKTTMLSPIIDEVKKRNIVPFLMAPTGRAARVIESKTGIGASTIHKMIYALDNIETKDDSDKIRYIFPLRDESDKARDHICIVDESSMIGTREIKNELFEFGTGSLLCDLLTFVCPHKGGKIIFIGDPMQLPPVGDNCSNAFDEHFFDQLGLKTMVGELSEVVRQGADSTILKNAMKIRALIEEPIRNHLVFDRKDGEVMDLEGYNMPSKLLALYPQIKLNQSVIITFSNRQARDYNLAIREQLFPGEKNVTNGDILQVVSNNYMLNVMNGDFVEVVSVSDVQEVQTALVYVDVGGTKKQQKVSLTFRDVYIKTDDGKILFCKIIDSLLDDGNADLTLSQIQALYINFCMRHEKLKRSSDEFKALLKNDPYFNALRVKYGYAITGHKSQGGEWETVFVDYSGRTGLDTDCLRWAYTVTTRARNTLYGYNMPNVTQMSKLKVTQITKSDKSQDEYQSFTDIPQTPFHTNDAPNFLKAKYWVVKEEVEKYSYRIMSLESKSYCEWYFIEGEQGVHKFQCFYNKAGVFTNYMANDSSEESSEILSLLQVNMTSLCSYRYEPSSLPLMTLYNTMESLCSEYGVKITNIVEYPSKYFVRYYLQTDSTFAYIQFFFSIKGFITYAQPFASLGADDLLLKKLTDKIRE